MCRMLKIIVIINTKAINMQQSEVIAVFFWTAYEGIRVIAAQVWSDLS